MEAHGAQLKAHAIQPAINPELLLLDAEDHLHGRGALGGRHIMLSLFKKNELEISFMRCSSFIRHQKKVMLD